MNTNKPKALTDKGPIAGLLTGNPFLIVLLIAVIILIVGILIVYTDSMGKDSVIKQLKADQSALKGTYDALSGDFAALSANYTDLNQRYQTLSINYENTSSELYLLQGKKMIVDERINNFLERNATISYKYELIQGIPSNLTNTTGSKVIATVYNVGDKDAIDVLVSCNIIIPGSNMTSTYNQTITVLKSMDKKQVEWVFDYPVEVISVWARMY